jgi:hypothetical protein
VGTAASRRAAPTASIFLASSFSGSQAESTSAPAPVTPTVGRPAISSYHGLIPANAERIAILMKDIVKFLGKTWGFIGLVLGILSIITLIGGMLHRQQPDLGFLLPPEDEIKANRNDLNYRRFVVQLMLIKTDKYSSNAQQEIEELTQFLQLNPSYTKAYLARGLIFFSVGQYSSGLSDMGRVVAEATDPPLRQRAIKETRLARLAQTLMPISILGAAVVTLLHVVEWLKVRLDRWGRGRIIAFWIAYAVWIISLAFFIFYSGFIEAWIE